MLIYYKFNNELFNNKIHKYSSLYKLKYEIFKRVKDKNNIVILFNNRILNYLDDNIYLNKLGEMVLYWASRKIKGEVLFNNIDNIYCIIFIYFTIF